MKIVSLKEKLAYSLCIIGDIPFTIVTSSFLLIFYTNVVGLDPAACATLFLIARIVDGLNDPLVGIFIDRRPYTKWGHFRPTLLVGGILCALNFGMMWLGPLWAPAGKLAIAYVTYLLLGVLFPLMDISLNSMLPVMTENSDERNQLSTIRGGVQQVMSLIISFAAPLIVANTSEASGYIKLTVITVLSGIFCICAGTAGLKENVKVSEKKTYRIREILDVFKLKPMLAFYIAILLSGIGMSLMLTSNTYFFTYIFGGMAIYSVVSIVNSVFCLPTLFTSGFFVKRFGKKGTFIVGVLVLGLATLLRMFDLTNVPLLFLSTAIMALGQGLRSPIQYNLMAELTDYAELKLGVRSEAGVASASSFVAKVGMGIAGAIPGYLLALSGFDSTMQVQSPSTNAVIVVCTILLPAALQILAAAVMYFFYPIGKKEQEKLEREVKELHEKGITDR
ncbi:MAG: glycoside-pentoside-hexuronide (GPH):cation symporter [Eubacteriales bacterium]|nr:glycoside-pentoside-hexuronide (GPH):cation symporter [Eubacteriales bacterium]